MSADIQPFTVLLVDDDPGHCELVTRHLRRAGIGSMVVVHNGAEALTYLRAHLSEPRPRELLILLDINMPGGLSGIDVLAAIKTEPATRMIPVIMLTTADNPREINRCYELGCNVYVTKPVDPERLRDAVSRLGMLISVIRLPVSAGGMVPVG